MPGPSPQPQLMQAQARGQAEPTLDRGLGAVWSKGLAGAAGGSGLGLCRKGLNSGGGGAKGSGSCLISERLKTAEGLF